MTQPLPLQTHEWDLRFMSLARHIAGWSKDPSTKVGAVLVDNERRVLGLGYNGFPRWVKDLADRLDDRETKYSLVVHAELNAILNCAHRPVGSTLYVWPLYPCSECGKAIIQAGIARVVGLATGEERWQKSNSIAFAMFTEADIRVTLINPEEVR